MEPHVDGPADTPERMLEILRLVDAPALRVNFYISHFDILGMSTKDSVAALVPCSVHTHLKDQRGRYPDYRFLTPGEGGFDYARHLLAMQEAGNDGSINAEVSMLRQRNPDYDPVAACGQCCRTSATAFEAAGIARR